MPIVLDDTNNVSVIDVQGSKVSKFTSYTPKFFHKSVLTGKGGQSKGLLNESRDPKMFKNGYPKQIAIDMEPSTSYHKDIKIYNIPCYIISPYLWEKMTVIDRPSLGKMTKIATKGTEEIYLQMPIHAVEVEEVQVPTGGYGSSATQTKRSLSAALHLFLFSIKNPQDTKHTQVQHMSYLDNAGNTYFQDVIWNIFVSLRSVEYELTKNGYDVDKDAMNDFVQQYSLYTELCKAAERWQSEIDFYIADVLCTNINDYSNGQLYDAWGSLEPIWRYVSNVLSRLEKYNVPLDKYQSIYDKISATLPTDVVTEICKANLNLRLSNTLQHMNNNRTNLNNCPNNVHVQPKNIPYSNEQMAAIESTSPLTLVQSGAGTGKSTVIHGRIEHMIANGIDPKDITVLSFTNAAANHINELIPSVHSMTIAYMLHSIYSNNYPDHELSSLSTIINSIDIYYPSTANISAQQRNFVDNFSRILCRLRDKNEYTQANNFVETHIDEVIDVLNTIQQTSLELEGIICYQKMDTLVEPPETQTKHLIIDEVQDNSIAEFIYSIKYTDKHCCSLYIVGDCSQTLYEFRASNPKALNVLEGSGVFEIHKLQTNYRSNQEILDFANIGLNNIEANQYANIQLKANSLKPVTLQSFTDAVQFAYYRMANKSYQAMDAMLAHSIVIDAKAYIDDKLAKGEQVCILAFRKRTLQTIRETIEKAYPGSKNKIASLIPERPNDATPFSKFIADQWDNIVYTPPTNILTTIERMLISSMKPAWGKSTKAQMYAEQTAQVMIDDFKAKHGREVADWETQVQLSTMTQAQMLDEIKKLMITYEIRRNSKKQAIMSNKNAEAKAASEVQNADFIFSTIHSVKGLEFDNVLVYYESSSESTMEESDKRAYYVALTRAKKTEFIFAYDTMAHPKIQGDYETIIKELKLMQTQANNATGITISNTDADKCVNTAMHVIDTSKMKETDLLADINAAMTGASQAAASIDPSVFASVESLTGIPVNTSTEPNVDTTENATTDDNSSETSANNDVPDNNSDNTSESVNND